MRQPFVKRRIEGRPINLRAIYCGAAGKKGMGVFAGQTFRKGALIERCEVVFFPKEEVDDMRKTQLEYYFYWWWLDAAVLPLGFGAIYNHSSHPNAEWIFDRRARRMTVKALHTIQPHEEITVNYYIAPEDMWFTPVD